MYVYFDVSTNLRVQDIKCDMRSVRKQVNIADSATTTSFVTERFFLSKAKQKQFQVMNSRMKSRFMKSSTFLQIVVMPAKTNSVQDNYNRAVTATKTAK